MNHTNFRRNVLVAAALCGYFSVITSHAIAPRPAVNSPTPWTTLPNSSSVTFGWNNGGLSGVQAYKIIVGSAVGTQDIYPGSGATVPTLSSSTVSKTVSSIPLDSGTIYVRLSYQVSGVWHSSDTGYRSYRSTPSLMSPSEGSMLPGASTTFYWDANEAAVGQWWVYVGTSLGGSNLLNYNAGLNTNATVNNLSAGMVYLRLWYHDGSSWIIADDYQFWGPNGVTMNNIAEEETIGETFTFEGAPNGAPVDNYWFYIGSEPGEFDIASDGGPSSMTFSDLPTDGRIVYVRLWHSYIGNWYSRDYKFHSFVGGYPKLTQPANGSQFTANPENIQNYQWTPATAQISQFFLYVGETPGANNHFSASVLPGVSALDVPNLLTHGETLYNSFWFKSAGRWWEWQRTVIAALTDDFDNDGIRNPFDFDIDGDGYNNDVDTNIDGDEFPNAIDLDSDGDGTPDVNDDSPNGTDMTTHEQVAFTFNDTFHGHYFIEIPGLGIHAFEKKHQSSIASGSLLIPKGFDFDARIEAFPTDFIPGVGTVGRNGKTAKVTVSLPSVTGFIPVIAGPQGPEIGDVDETDVTDPPDHEVEVAVKYISIQRDIFNDASSNPNSALPLSLFHNIDLKPDAQSEKILPGQRASLKIEDTTGLNLTFTDINWTIMGVHFEDYSGSGSLGDHPDGVKGILTALTAAELVDEAIKFHWAETGVHDIRVNFFG